MTAPTREEQQEPWMPTKAELFDSLIEGGMEWNDAKGNPIEVAGFGMTNVGTLEALIRRAARLRAIEELEWFVDNGDFANFASKDEMRARLAQLRAEGEEETNG